MGRSIPATRSAAMVLAEGAWEVDALLICGSPYEAKRLAFARYLMCLRYPQDASARVVDPEDQDRPQAEESR